MLTFAWKIRDHSALHLIMAFVGLAALMAGFFLIFRITYPTMKRASATPQRVVILDPADPVARAIIHRAEDKSFALFPDESGQGTAPSLAPVFRPSFEGARVRLRGLLAAPETPKHPKLFTPAASVLPAIPPRAVQPPVVLPPTVLKAVPSPELARRSPQKAAIEGIPLTEPYGIQFRIAVSAAGQVVFALPLSSIDDAPLMQRLQSAVKALRFTPDPKQPRTWGTLSFRWETTAP